MILFGPQQVLKKTQMRSTSPTYKKFFHMLLFFLREHLAKELQNVQDDLAQRHNKLQVAGQKPQTLSQLGVIGANYWHLGDLRYPKTNLRPSQNPNHQLREIEHHQLIDFLDVMTIFNQEVFNPSKMILTKNFSVSQQKFIPNSGFTPLRYHIMSPFFQIFK